MNNCQKEILVSIVIPIYNVEKYIERCIDSVINQTWDNLEIICVNDGTKDNSMEIVEKRAAEDKRIRIINIENSGLSMARNKGAEKANGKYIYFLDSDDWIAENTIEESIKYAEQYELDVLQFNAECIFESDEIAQRQSNYTKYYVRNHTYSGIYVGQQLFTEMINNWDFKPSAWLNFINRDFLVKIGLEFYPGILHEDNLYTALLLKSATKVMFIDEPFYKRFVREASITSGEQGVKHAYGYYVCQRELLAALANSDYSMAYFEALQNYFGTMRKNSLKVLQKFDINVIKEEIIKIEPAAEGDFLYYFYKDYVRARNANQNVKHTVSNNFPASKRGYRKVKNMLKRIRNKIKKIRNKIINKIPGPLRWFCRTMVNYGPGYFIYRKKLKDTPDKICVSIVMPVYNVEKYLERTLETLLNQKLKNIEIICIDDGSTDGSLDILQKYQKKDSRIKVFQQENKGAGAARNLGLDNASGEYLLFLDSDDIFDENLCNEVYYQSIRKKADVCMFGAQRLDMQTLKTEPMEWVLRKSEIPMNNLFSGKSACNKLFQMTSGCPWSKMFRREFVVENGIRFQDLKNTNDAFFIRMNMALANRITTVKRCFVTYRYNEGNNIQSNKSKAPLEFYEAFKEMKRELQQRGMFEIFERTYCNMVLKESLFNLKTAGTVEAQEQIKKLLKEEAIDFYGLRKHPKEYYYVKNEYEEMSMYF